MLSRSPSLTLIINALSESASKFYIYYTGKLKILKLVTGFILNLSKRSYAVFTLNRSCAHVACRL